MAYRFADGHVRQLPRLTAGPFQYHTYAYAYLEEARKHTRLPVKQAVIDHPRVDDAV
jgi:5-methyltetrahydropteroyltriglutamate--homocysteine methyltransferase